MLRHSGSLIAGACLLLCSLGIQAQQEPADIVFHNGKILTVDTDAGDFTVAQAVAVRADRIAAVGTNAQVLALAGPGTRRIDLKGKAMMPGIIDTHTHPQQYAGYRTAPDTAPDIAAYHMIEGPRLNVNMRESLDYLMEHLQARIQEDMKKPADDHPWMYYLLRSSPGDADAYFFKEFDRYDLDELAPSRPMIVDADGNLMANSAALEALQQKVPLSNLDPELDANGEPTGRLGGRAPAMIAAIVPDSRRDFFPGKNRLSYMERIRLLADTFEAELRDHWAHYGITTIGSKLDAEGHAALSKLVNEGRMPVRWAVHIESFRNPGISDFLARQMPNMQGQGTPQLWMAGIYGGSADSWQCTNLPSEVKHLESCDLTPGGELWESLYPAVRSGWRISGFHVHGDLAVDHILLLIEQASAEAGMTADDIRAKRHMLDHCTVNPRPDQIERGKRLGVSWTCGPKYIIRAPIDAEGYDSEVFAKWVVPMRSLIDAGLKPGFHTDGDQGGPMAFKYMQTTITRKDMNGRTWNANEAIDRGEALRAATRWNAFNLMKGDELGSIEPGKLADIIIIDRDYMSVPIEQMPDIKVLMTLVGGKVVYEAAGL